MAGRFRLKRKAAKDFATTLGAVLVVSLVLFSLPELDSDLSRADLVLAVVAGGALFMSYRLISPLFRKGSHRRRGSRERSRRRASMTDASN